MDKAMKRRVMKVTIKFNPHLIFKSINKKHDQLCDEKVDINSLSLAYIPDHFKNQEMCDKVVRNKLCMLLFVPDHFWKQECATR